MKKHNPINLSPAERADLGSITKHPGMSVLLERIMRGHLEQELHSIHDVSLDDPNRTRTLEAICASAYAMKLNLELVKSEISRNWKILEEEEMRRRKEMEPANA